MLAAGCSDDSGPAADTGTSETGDGDSGDGDGDSGDGDGDSGDGDGDSGDGDGDSGDGDGDSGDGDGDSGDGDGDGDGDGACGPQTFEDGKVPDAEIHVATDGADGPDCGAPGSPCASIEHAAGLASPGTAVVVHEGSYAGGGYITNLAGTEAAPIWIGGAQGEDRPVIDGGGEAFKLGEVRYLIIHDLEVVNSTQNGINADDGGNYDDPDASRYIVFRDLWVHDVGNGGNQDCLKLSGLDDYWVLDSQFERCGGGGSGSAIDQVGCHRGLIHGNAFADLMGAGGAVQCKGGAEDIEIRANTFDDAGERGVNMGGSTGFEYFRPPLSPDQPNAEARDIRVIANSFRGGVTPFAFVGCVDCLAANNVIDSPQNWVFRILQETVSGDVYEFLPASEGRFVNNIVYFDGQVNVAVNVGGNTDPGSFSLETNLWYRHDNPGQSDPPGGLPGVAQGSIIGEDPLFADPGAGDYHLDPASPAVGAGTALDELSGDLDGECFADPPSVGALEL
ncbi:hypothetical protein ENSA5_42190 [Enhygromyxa salina]|uniref:Endo-1,4-beta-xylanase A n=1 Tax=Enhygromyxa salina TaxID=215803 RepID=A0A2S9XLR4_9BACT|nr:hypothetical protein [Enhygromyxa salina]PRP93816.1 hypothetical protein ENSA5_42190 [Enhygromyxa salina]